MAKFLVSVDDATFDLPEPVKGRVDAQIDARTGTGKRPVGRDELVVNVADYGAKGDGVTDDTAAINAAVAAASAKGPRTRLRFPATQGGAYRATTSVTIPGQVDLEMDAPLLFDGTGPALIVGETGPNRHSRSWHRIRVHRAALSTMTDEADVGVRLINFYWSDVHIVEVTNFTIGVQIISTASQGFAYNKFYLGMLRDNKVHIDLEVNSGGWVNENKFFGGAMSNTSGFPAVDRTGVRFSSAVGYYSNANVFYAPSFEIDGFGKSFEGTAVEAAWAGPGNKFLDARYESPSRAVVTTNASSPVLFNTAYDDGVNLPTLHEEGTLAGSIIETTTRRSRDSAKRLVFKADRLHKRACFYNGSSSVNVPGVNWTIPGAAVDHRRAVGATITSDYLERGTGAALGTYLSTAALKRFVVVVDAEGSAGGRLAVRCHDAAGGIVSAAGTVRVDVGSITISNGVWTTTSDTVAPRFFAVTDNVAYVWVGIAGGTAPFRLRSFAIYALDGEGDAATWLPWPDSHESVAATPPTAGTWEVGRRILRDPPAVGQPQGWVCTVAGTPGTWVPMPNL